MYKVMIIDDEASARKLMHNSIDWESMNMQVVGEAASGIEAINVIDDLKPDIAFVDISMPFMDGIEFTEVATGRYPNLIIIIMTAIDKFEYARKCVSLPVFDLPLQRINELHTITITDIPFFSFFCINCIFYYRYLKLLIIIFYF